MSLTTPLAGQGYPFAGLVGLDELRLLLVLAAIDPGLGGVLISGPRGTAKSTAARALAELLPAGRLVNLPLGATEDRLIGSLDVEAMLQQGRLHFAPGLLAAADGGVLYVDEVNLLADHLIDILLDVAASGINTIERDGISHSHSARFVLIGTMNPEEGELRPQLLDRFGVMVTLDNCLEPSQRQAMVEARLAYEADPTAFRAEFAAEQRELRQRLLAAQQQLSRLSYPGPVKARVASLCIDAGVDGLRADLAMLRAARALAAWEQAAQIELAHVERVAAACLRHRARVQPAPNPAPAVAPAAEHTSAEAVSTPMPASEMGEHGYLAPEPVSIHAVKAVRPLPPKR